MPSTSPAGPVRALPPFPFRVIVVDEGREGPARLARVLGSAITLDVVDNLRALDEALLTWADLLIVEHRLAWGDSVSVIRFARARVPSLGILVLTDHGDERLAVETLRAGANNYLRASTDDDTLRDVVHEALSPWNSSAADDPHGVPALLDALGTGFLRSTPDGRVVDANPAAARMARLPDVAVMARLNTRQFYQSEEARAQWLETMEQHIVLKSIGHMVRADGTPALCETFARAVKHASGKTLCYEAHLRDVTERESLRERVVYQASLLEHVRHPVMGVDNDFVITYWNAAGETLLGWTAADVVGRSMFDVLVPPDQRELARSVIAQLAATGDVEFVADDLSRDGARVPTHKWAAALTEGGRRIGSVVVFVDQRELHQRERDLERALDDREALLREIHHRVKNNLQVVSSLLGLQLRRTDADDVRAVVEQCRARLRAIGAIHELLYRLPGHGTVSTTEFLSMLIARVESAVANVPALTVGRVTATSLGADMATDLGVVLTEVALTWAQASRPDGTRTRLQIDLDHVGEHHELSFTDVTVGATDERNQVIAAMAKDLAGEFARELQCDVVCSLSPAPSIRIRCGSGTR